MASLGSSTRDDESAPSSGRSKTGKYAKSASTTYELTGGGTLWEADASKYGWDEATSDTSTVSRSSRGLYDDTGSSGFTSFGSTLKPTETTIRSVAYAGEEPEDREYTTWEAGEVDEDEIKKKARIAKASMQQPLVMALRESYAKSTGNPNYDAKIRREALGEYIKGVATAYYKAEEAATEAVTDIFETEQAASYKEYLSERSAEEAEEKAAWNKYLASKEETTVTTYGSTDEDKVTLDDYRIV